MAAFLHFAGLAPDCSDFMPPCFQNYPPHMISKRGEQFGER